MQKNIIFNFPTSDIHTNNFYLNESNETKKYYFCGLNFKSNLSLQKSIKQSSKKWLKKYSLQTLNLTIDNLISLGKFQNFKIVQLNSNIF